MAIPVRIRRNADGTISDITLCPKQEDIYAEKFERLEKQLKIAVEQLKDIYVICFRNKDTLLHTPEHNIIGGIERDCAIALKQIKELEKNNS